MKLKIDAIQAKYLPLDMKGRRPTKPVLKIIAGDFEATTTRVENHGEEFQFPEVFQIDIDEEEYAQGKLMLEVEAYDFATGDYVYIGKGQDVLKNLVHGIDNNIYFIVDLAAYEPRFEGPRKCEILMRGVVTNKDPLEEELIQKNEELAEVKKSYEDFVKSAKEMEDEMEGAMQIAQQKIEKLSKKNKDTTAKLNNLTEDNNKNVEEINRLRIELEELRRSQKDKSRQEEANSAIMYKYEELKLTSNSLHQEKKELLLRLNEYEEVKVSMQVELDELHASRYQAELKQADRINELQLEVSRLRGQRNEAAASAEALHRMASMEEEIKELRAVAASSAITDGGGFFTRSNNSNTTLNMDFLESLVNSPSEQDLYIANIIKKGDVEKLKEALVNLLRLYNELKVRNARLLARISSLQGSLTVCCRTRPPSEEEIKRGGKLCIDASDDSTVYVYDKHRGEWLNYEVDCVWGYDKKQADVFYDAEPLVAAVVSGCDAFIITHGDANTGKSFTSTGFDDQLGINYRAMVKTFELLELQRLLPDTIFGVDATPAEMRPEVASSMSFQVELSVMALIEEQAFDLVLSERLNEGGNFGKPLDLVYDASEGAVDVPFLLKVPVSSASEAMITFAKVVSAVSDSRGLPPHAHLLMQLTVTVKQNETAAPVTAKLSVFDLASVDNKLSMNDPANAGIAALQSVLKALASKARSIPYGESKLTKLLHPALTGAAKTMLVMSLSPTHLTLNESIKSLELATTARKIRADPAKLAAVAALKNKSGDAASSTETRNLEAKLRALKSELENAKLRSASVEKKVMETRDGAEGLITQLNDYNDSITNKYQLEKQQNLILANDLKLTKGNTAKTLVELKKQIAINERLLGIVKAYEQELNTTSRH